MEVYILDTLDDPTDYPNGCSEDKTSFERIHRELADVHLHHGAESHDVAARITGTENPYLAPWKARESLGVAARCRGLQTCRKSSGRLTKALIQDLLT